MRLFSASGASISIIEDGNTARVFPALADAMDENENPLFTAAGLLGFNGSTLDMVRSAGDNADGVSSRALGVLLSLARLTGYNGSTWDRLAVGADNADAVAVAALGRLLVTARLAAFNGSTWDRVRSEGNDRDAISVSTLGNIESIVYGHAFNGTSWDRQRALGTAALDGLGQLSTSPAVPGASVVLSHYDISASNTTTRYTLVTPNSGKRIRIISIDTLTRGGPFDLECYFGTGANIGSTPANGIATASLRVVATNEAPTKLLRIWPDGGGPVGAADQVVSLRTTSDASTDIDSVIHYREE